MKKRCELRVCDLQRKGMKTSSSRTASPRVATPRPSSPKPRNQREQPQTTTETSPSPNPPQENITYMIWDGESVVFDPYGPYRLPFGQINLDALDHDTIDV